MKIFTIFILLFFSCNSAKEVNDDLQQTKLIQGNWELCKRKFDDDYIVSNICQTLKLNENGNGKLLAVDNLLCRFKWKIEKGFMKLSFDSPDSKKNFFLGEVYYNYKMLTEGDIQYLELKSQEQGIVYYLGRATKNK